VPRFQEFSIKTYTTTLRPRASRLFTLPNQNTPPSVSSTGNWCFPGRSARLGMLSSWGRDGSRGWRSLCCRAICGPLKPGRQDFCARFKPGRRPNLSCARTCLPICPGPKAGASAILNYYCRVTVYSPSMEGKKSVTYSDHAQEIEPGSRTKTKGLTVCAIRPVVTNGSYYYLKQ